MKKRKIKNKVGEFFRPTKVKIGILCFLIISVFLGISCFSYFSVNFELRPRCSPFILLLFDPLEQFGEWMVRFFGLPDIIFILIGIFYYYIYSCILALIIISIGNVFVKIDKRIKQKKLSGKLYYFLRPTIFKLVLFLTLVTFSFLFGVIFRHFEPIMLLFTLLGSLNIPHKISYPISITFGAFIYYIISCVLELIKHRWEKISKKD